MAGLQLLLTADERQFLVDLLESTLKNTLVEEHRTRAPNYREHIVEREELITGLLTRLRQFDG